MTDGNPTSFQKKLEIFRKVLTIPSFVTVQSHPEFIADYINPDCIEHRIKAFGGDTAFKAYKRQEPFMPLVEAFVGREPNMTRKEIEAEAGKALVSAIGDGNMRAIEDLVEAFQIKRGESRVLENRRIKAASYFQSILDGEPFESQTLDAQITELFLKICDDCRHLPTREQLRKKIRLIRREEIHAKGINIGDWTRNFGRRLALLGLSKLPRC